MLDFSVPIAIAVAFAFRALSQVYLQQFIYNKSRNSRKVLNRRN